MSGASRFIVLLLCLTFTYFGKAQNAAIDSLENILKNRKAIDGPYIDVLNELAFEYIKADPSKGILLINRSLRLSDSIKYDLGVFRATIHHGSSFWINGLYDEALKHYLKAASMQVDDPAGYQFLYNNIGETYKKKNQLDSAISWLRKSINFSKGMEDQMPPMLASNMAEAFFQKKQYDSAAGYYNLSLDLSVEAGLKRGVAYSLFGLADIAQLKGNSEEALVLHHQALDIREEIQDKRGIIQSLMRLSDLTSDQGAIDESISFLISAEQIGIETNSVDLLYGIYFKLYEFYHKQEDFETANSFLVEYHQLKDSLESVEFVNRIGTIQSALNAEAKSAENTMLRKQQEQQQIIVRNQTAIIISIAVGILILIAFLYQYYKRFKQSKRHGQKLQDLNDTILQKNNQIEAINKQLDSRLVSMNKLLSESQQLTKLGSWEFDTKTSEMHWTDESYRQLGLTPGSQQASLKLFKKYCSKEDFKRTFNMLRTVIQKGESQELNVTIKTEKNEERILSFKFVPEFTNGELTRLYGTNLDITKQVALERLEQRIIESLLQLSYLSNLKSMDYETFLNHLLKIACLTLGMERASFWRFQNSNDLLICQKLYDAPSDSYSSGQVFAVKEFKDYFDNFDSNRTLNIQDVFAEKSLNAFHGYFDQFGIKSKLDIQVKLEGAPMGILSFATTSEQRSWSYSDQRYAGSLSDILNTAYSRSLNKKLEKEKSDLIERLTRKNQSLREFAYVISHNLREPVTQIMGLTRIYKDEDNEQIRPEIISRIESASQKLDLVIADLNNVLNHEEMEYHDYDVVKITELLRGIEEKMHATYPDSEFKINQMFDEELEIRSIADFLFNIFEGLVSNAIQFSKDKMLTIVEIAVEQNTDEVKISIIDNGIGMDLESNRERLFKMYQRFHTGRGGKGIGLFMVKNQVELLGGKIDIRSEVDQGTTAIITLPQYGETLLSAELIDQSDS